MEGFFEADMPHGQVEGVKVGAYPGNCVSDIFSKVEKSSRG